MSTYTVEIQNSSDGVNWYRLGDGTETVEDSGPADDVAEWAARNQNLVEGAGWRVRVWEGRDATGEPAAEYYAPSADDETCEECESTGVDCAMHS